MKNKFSFRLNRRRFVKDLLVSVGVLAITPVSFSSVISNLDRKRKPVNGKSREVFVFQDRAHFGESGMGTVYSGPRAMASTKKYVDSLSHEEFLKRHWYV